VTLVDTDPAILEQWSVKYGVSRTAASLDAVLADPDVDAVHLITPIPLHARQSVQVLRAGRHCACTVPAATSLEDLHALVRARRESGKVYMMMETAVYTREFFLAQAWLQGGQLGRIQLLRGAHYQDMELWPDYWMGLPPMHYATHAVGPLLCLAGTRASHVHCFGSGTMRGELVERYGNPYPAETAIIRLEGSAAAAEVTRTLFETARDYTESFTVIGSAATFEWQQLEDELPVRFAFSDEPSGRRGRSLTHERVEAPDRADLLPEPIRRFTRRGVYDTANAHLSFLQGGGHGGSHPHLVHAFVSAAAGGRPSAIDAITAADWTAVGICAHQSAMSGGARVEVPAFA
jgi:predicted dehydrogenase